MAFAAPQRFLVSEYATGVTKHIDMSVNDKIDDLKNCVTKYFDIPKDKQVLFVDGDELDSEFVIKDCGFPPITPLFVIDLRKSPDADEKKP
jgi:hypothetical protein